MSGCDAVNSIKNLKANTICGFSESMMPLQYVEQQPRSLVTRPFSLMKMRKRITDTEWNVFHTIRVSSVKGQVYNKIYRQDLTGMAFSPTKEQFL